jgi:hypothetical protein
MCRSDSAGANGEGSHPELERWYHVETLSQLRYLWRLVEKQSAAGARRILTLVFSDVLFSCASPGRAQTSTGKRRRHHWGWIADNVHPTVLIEQNAIRLFASKLMHVAKIRRDAVESDACVLQQDARCLGIATGSVDLVVTSPPYISVIDYTRSNRLLYLWMNWPFDWDRQDEIGARFKRSRQLAADEYLADMRACWTELNRVMRPGAYCALVMGESRKFSGTTIRTIEELTLSMPTVWGPVSRNPSRRRVSERAARETIEYMWVLRKP